MTNQMRAEQCVMMHAGGDKGIKFRSWMSKSANSSGDKLSGLYDAYDGATKQYGAATQNDGATE